METLRSSPRSCPLNLEKVVGAAGASYRYLGSSLNRFPVVVEEERILTVRVNLSGTTELSVSARRKAFLFIGLFESFGNGEAKNRGRFWAKPLGVVISFLVWNIRIAMIDWYCLIGMRGGIDCVES